MLHTRLPQDSVQATVGRKPCSLQDVDFSLNGRFYSQAVTGVQRYAREITIALDALMRPAGFRGSLILPSNFQKLPTLPGFNSVVAKGAVGHLWEQIILPMRAEAPIINLCNTGPIAARRQIVCMHDANVFDEPSSYSYSFRTGYRSLLPYLVRRGARITSVSKYSSVQLAKHLSIASRDIEVIYNGHEHVFRWDASASRIKERLTGIRPFVLLLGSRARHKNADFILKQADVLDTFGLDLVVAGGTAQIFSSMQSVDGTNIHRLGFVSDDDLAYLYQHALCLAFPSLSEGFGLPIVEAMALGCPVIASDQSCMPEICGGAALLARPDDAPAWRKHFQDLGESTSLRTELQLRGAERAKAFSWFGSAQNYLNLVADVR